MLLKTIRTIHQMAGVIGAILILIMGITGILLNHKSWIGYHSKTAFQMQKWIFGLHSGALGHTSFVWLTDLGALCMITLSMTGLWLWINVTLRKTLTIRKKRRVNRSERS